jgi:hypothetical protein
VRERRLRMDGGRISVNALSQSCQLQQSWSVRAMEK